MNSPGRPPVVHLEMKQQEIWQMQYRNRRYMKYLTANDLQQRFVDVLSNLTVLSPKGLISLHDWQGRGAYWMSLFADIQEEYALRGEGLPARDTLKEMRLPRATAPKPPKSAWICEPLLKELEGTAYLVKYGKAIHLQRALDAGTWKISAASTFADSSLDSARRDEELERIVEMQPEDLTLEVLEGMTGKQKGIFKPRENVVMTATSCDFTLCVFRARFMFNCLTTSLTVALSSATQCASRSASLKRPSKPCIISAAASC
jgi:hypothetical protein